MDSGAEDVGGSQVRVWNLVFLSPAEGGGREGAGRSLFSCVSITVLKLILMILLILVFDKP